MEGTPVIPTRADLAAYAASDQGEQVAAEVDRQRWRLRRRQYAVYETREAAMDDGFPDAEWGVWQSRPSSTERVEGWIALEVEDTQE